MKERVYKLRALGLINNWPEEINGCVNSTALIKPINGDRQDLIIYTLPAGIGDT